MRIFLSYSSTERPLAERIYEALEAEGHVVFFDREALPPGEAYDQRIRDAVQACQVFVFLVCPAAIDAGSYSLTELALVEQIDEPRRPALLPVLTAPTDFATLPAFLAARTIYQPRGNVPAEVAAQVDKLRREIERPAPNLVANRTNQGWLIYFDLAGEVPQEIFYRLAESEPWTSTGFLPYRNSSTGRPLAHPDVPLLAGRSPREIFVKYIDASGREQGPYRLAFDPRDQSLRNCRDALRMAPWVAFMKGANESLNVYFTMVLTYKDAYTEVRYSVDDDSLSRQLRFESDPSRLALGLGQEDEVYVEVPAKTEYVCVQVHFVDGTVTETKKFTVADLGVAG